jgi:hypothetical protein
MANLSTKIHHVFFILRETKHTMVIWVTMLY